MGGDPEIQNTDLSLNPACFVFTCRDRSSRTLHTTPFYCSGYRYGNPIQRHVSTYAGLPASWLHKYNPGCFQFLLGSYLDSVLVTLRPCSQVSIAEESGSILSQGTVSLSYLEGLILAYNSPVPFHLSLGCILLTHRPAQGPSLTVFLDHGTQILGKTRGTTNPALLLENGVPGAITSSGSPHTKWSSFCLVSRLSSSSIWFLSVSPVSWHFLSSKPPWQPSH